MKEKKNIDQFFKEQLQHFDAAPSPEVWDRIEAQLQEKKKERRIIPLWWRVAGVAALLALLLTMGISLFNTNQKQTPQLVEESTVPTNDELSDPTHVKEIFQEQTPVEDAVATELKVVPQSTTETEPTDPSIYSVQKKDGVVSKKEVATVPPNKTSNTSSNKSKTNNKPQPKKASTIYNTKNEAVAITKDANKPSSTSSETTQPPLVKEEKLVVSEKEAVAQSEKQNRKNSKITNEGLFNDTNKKVPAKVTAEAAIANEEKGEELPVKKSIFDAIEENKQLEDAVAKQEQPSSNRWAVTPNAGPVYYSSLSGGSSIDPMFADNAQSGDVNVSYGVQVAYEINDKMAIRSGVNNVNLSYATGGVEVASAPLELGLKNVDYGANRSSVTTVFDKGRTPMTQASGGLGTVTPKSTGGNAELSQRIQYFEVPLELNYSLLETRFGIDVIGGMSTLFLDNNELVVNDGDFRTVLGEANNLNSISFTTNIGLGFHYQLSKKFKFNIEPMFKYQLNPYTDSSVDFRPYYLGVYSGLSFKF